MAYSSILKNGTVTVAAGSAVVTGTGTTWLDDGVLPGARITIVGEPLPFGIAKVASNTSLTLDDAAINGTTGARYAIDRLVYENTLVKAIATREAQWSGAIDLTDVSQTMTLEAGSTGEAWHYLGSQGDAPESRFRIGLASAALDTLAIQRWTGSVWSTMLSFNRSTGSVVGAGGNGAALVYTSNAAMVADLAHAAAVMAWLVGDADPSLDGIYQKVGASGGGSWVRAGDLPYSFASAIAAGTANAITATTDVAASESTLIALTITAPNTASPVTVAFNGGATLTVLTASGADIPIGGFSADAVVLGKQDLTAGTFRLVSDYASAAIITAAEAAATAAASSASSASAAAATATTASAAASTAATTAVEAALTVYPAIGKNHSYVGRRVANALLGTAPIKCLVIGHSHCAGGGAGTGTDGSTNAALHSWPEQLADALAPYGLTSKRTGWLGNYNIATAAALTDFDPRIVLGSGWVPDGGDGVILGGKMLTQPASQSGYLQYTPGYPVSAVDVLYPIASGLSSTVTVSGDGTVKGTINQSGASALGRQRVTFDAPVSVIAIKNMSTTAAAYICGIEAIPASRPDMEVSVAGHSGGTTTNFVSSAYPYSSLGGIAENHSILTIIYAMTNDILLPVTLSTFQSNLEIIANYSMSRGDTILVIDPPSSESPFASGSYEPYADAVYAAARKWGATVCDLRHVFSRWWGNMNADGYAFNSVHPNAAGYGEAAKYIASHIVETYLRA